MSKRRIANLSAVLCIAAVACTQKTEQKSTLTQRQKDSILAGSQIPGARAVKKTMTAADSAAARQARIDSAQENP
jgi:hypothetical protein